MLLGRFTLCLACCWFSLAPEGQAAPLPRCVLQLPIYDALGAPVSFVVTEVRGEGRNANLLRIADPQLRFVATGTRIHFPPRALGRQIELRVTLADGRSLQQLVPLGSCHQRFSLRVGAVRDSGADVFHVWPPPWPAHS